MDGNVKTVYTCCRGCFQACGMKITVSEDQSGLERIEKIEGMEEQPETKGYLCSKGLAMREYVESPDRLKYPLKKVPDGWKEISWDQALTEIADKLNELKSKYAPETIYISRGQGSDWGMTWDALIRFASAIGTPNHSNLGSFCYLPRFYGDWVTHGMAPPQPYWIPMEDYEKTKCMMVVGGNFPANNVSRTGYVLDAIDRGAKLIVLDPIVTRFASLADMHLQLRPATDVALLLGMIHIIIMEDLYDHDFVDNWTVGFDELREHIEDYSPEKVSDITGVSADKIKDVARIFANNKPAHISHHTGIDKYGEVAVQAARCIAILSAITGNLGVKGGNWYTMYPPIYAPPNRNKFRFADRIMGKKLADGDAYPIFKNWQYSTEPLSSFKAVIEEKPYPVKAVMVIGGNPAVTLPAPQMVREALGKAEITVVHECFMTKTAKLADYVLPAAMFLEHEGNVRVLTHHLLPQNKVVDPPGEAWSDIRLFTELAKKMGAGEFFQWENPEHDAVNEFLEPMGVTVEDLKNSPAGVNIKSPKDIEKRYLTDGFMTPSKKVELYSQRLKDMGYDPLPVYKDCPSGPNLHPEGKKFPMTAMAAGMAKMYSHSQYRTFSTLREIYPEPFADLHPNDAVARGIKDSDWITVRSPYGEVKMKCQVNEKTLPGIILIPANWGEVSDEYNFNNLVSDDFHDPYIGGPVMDLVCAEVEKAKEG